MSAPISFSTAKSIVIGILQASRTAYATTTDGTKRQFSSDNEINNAILSADGEIVNLIINTPGHPYQGAFVVTSVSPLTSGPDGVTIPQHNGMILRVLGLNGQTTVSVLSVSAGDDEVTTSSSHGLSTGQRIQFSGTTAGGGLSLATNYWVIVTASNKFRVATTPYNAYVNSYINLDGTAPNASVVQVQYIPLVQAKSADEVKEIYRQGGLYKYDASTANSLLPYFFIEGNTLYTTTLYSKLVYTDYDLASDPQSPEPYLYAVCSGAVARLLKDGGDDAMSAYYMAEFNRHKELVVAGARIVPAITAYKTGA